MHMNDVDGGRKIRGAKDRQQVLISIVTPAFNEAENLPVLRDRLHQALDEQDFDWEWIVVDDHSEDDTFAVLLGIAEKDKKLRAVRLARNSGSHIALVCGLDEAEGDCAVILASDLQDPPEMVPDLVSKWRAGAQVVWAERTRRTKGKAMELGLGSAFYWIMRHVIGIRNLPAKGSDFFLVDRRVVNASREFGERNVDILALIAWMGFRQTSIPYEKSDRLHGKSGWTFGKKVKMILDSITAFSSLPVRLMMWAGMFFALIGFAYAIVVINIALTAGSVPGWPSLMVVMLVIGGMLMLMMGVLGEYLWRSLDESRRRPRYLVEDETEKSDNNI